MLRTSVHPIATAAKLPLAVLLLPLACSTDSRSPGQDPSTPSDSPPTFQVDATWPRELPNDWILGSITSVFVDDRDHVWVTHLPETLTPEEIAAVQDPPLGECCVPAPVVIEFDTDGRCGAGVGRSRHAGRVGVPAQLPRPFHRPQRIRVDRDLPPPPGHEVHPRRPAPPDARSRTTKTAAAATPSCWAARPASGSIPKPTKSTSPTATATGASSYTTAIREPTCATGARTGTPPRTRPLYDYAGRTEADRATPTAVLDRARAGGIATTVSSTSRTGAATGSRVFLRDGTFVAEKTIAPLTRASGSAFVIALSPDADQRWLYLADGTNHKVWILRRSDMEVVGEFGRGGRQAGPVHPSARDGCGLARQHLRGRGIDRQKRVQKFEVTGGGGRC